MKKFLLNERTAHEIAEELISTKLKIKSLEENEHNLKEQLKEFFQRTESKSIDLKYGKVIYSESSGSLTFNRSEVIQHLKENYGDILAEKIDKACTKTGELKEIVSVKLKP